MSALEKQTMDLNENSPNLATSSKATSVHASEIDTYIDFDNDNGTTKKTIPEEGTDANCNFNHYSNGDQFLSPMMKVEMVNEQPENHHQIASSRAHTHNRTHYCTYHH